MGEGSLSIDPAYLRWLRGEIAQLQQNLAWLRRELTAPPTPGTAGEIAGQFDQTESTLVELSAILGEYLRKRPAPLPTNEPFQPATEFRE